VRSLEPRRIFVTGGTGYIGRRLIPLLARRGHVVTALVRRGSQTKSPEGCRAVVGDALDPESFVGDVPPADTFVQLVGVSHPSPAKADLFRRIDLASARAGAEAAARSKVAHFVYVSVARPAPAMKAYQAARAEGEASIQEKGLNATFLRPWYVLGPGHRWPLLLLPGYWLLERLPATRATARRLGLVTLGQMLAALVWTVENPPSGVRILEVPDIRNAPAIDAHGASGPQKARTSKPPSALPPDLK
jgi:uncharacterized protein YbjT (DUF2867 family)